MLIPETDIFYLKFCLPVQTCSQYTVPPQGSRDQTLRASRGIHQAFPL